jgi:hypothetical protein
MCECTLMELAIILQDLHYDCVNAFHQLLSARTTEISTQL